MVQKSGKLTSWYGKIFPIIYDGFHIFFIFIPHLIREGEPIFDDFF